MSHITRRFLKKTGDKSLEGDLHDDDVEGYKSFAELCKDLDEVINIIWLSGTRKFKLAD